MITDAADYIEWNAFSCGQGDDRFHGECPDCLDKVGAELLALRQLADNLISVGTGAYSEHFESAVGVLVERAREIRS